MFIRYSNKDKIHELEIGVNKKELLYLSHKIKENGFEIHTNFQKELSAAPYSIFLSGLQVRISDEKWVEFQVTEDSKLLLQGNVQKLSILSDVMLSFAEEWHTGEHLHIEYFPGHFYLSPKSVPVILVYDEDDENE